MALDAERLLLRPWASGAKTLFSGASAASGQARMPDSRPVVG